MSLTKQEAMKLLDEAMAAQADPEAAHSMADDALCGLLEWLGYSDVVKAWHRVPKWYA